MPKEERTSIKFSNFVRVNEDTGIDRLRDGDIPQLENMVLDNPFGKASMRGGFPLQNNAQTTNVIDKIVDVKSKDGTNYILAGHSTFVGRSVGGSYTNIKTGLAVGSGYFRHIAYGDDLILTNNNNKPFRLTGNDLSTTTDLELQKPEVRDVVIQRVTTSVGNLDASSVYLYVIVYSTDIGERSNPSNPIIFIHSSIVIPNSTDANQKQFYLYNLPIATDGNELVTNGSFSTDASWTKGTGWDIDSSTTDKAHSDGSQSADADLTQSITIVNGGRYRITFTISGYSAGNVAPVIDDVEGTDRSANGIYTEIITATSSSGDIDIRADLDFVGDIDDVSVELVDERVTSKWIYRTEGWDLSDANTGKTFFLVEKIDAEQIDYEDNVSDSDLDTSETIIFTRVPDKAKFVEQSNNRVWFGNLSLQLKSFFDPYVVANGFGANQTPSALTYADGTLGNLIAKTDVPYVGGAGGNGGLHSGRFYQYMYTYLDINDFESEPSYGEVFQTGGSLGNFRDVTIRYLGIGGIGGNDLVNNSDLKFRKIYRTEGVTDDFTSNSKDFKLVKQENIQHKPTPPVQADYEYFDDLADAAKDSGTGLGATYSENIDNNKFKGTISWSQVDRPAYFILENVRQIFRDDQDQITGIFDDGNGLLIFKENSIIKLYHTGASQNWYIRKVWTEFGCDEPKSMVKSGNTIYFRYQKRPYAFVSDSAPKYIGFGKQNTLDDMTVIDAVANDEWVMFACTQSSDHFILVYDKKINAWYQFNFSTNDLTALLIKKYDDFWITNNLYAVVNKRVFDYDKSVTADEISGSSSDISTTIKLPRIQIDGTTLSKLREVVMNFTRTGGINLTLTTETGSDSPTAIIASVSGIQRITGFGSKKGSDFFEVKLTGGLKQLSYLRTDLRPVKRGLS